MDVKTQIQNMTYEEFLEFHAQTNCQTSSDGDYEMLRALQIFSGKWRMAVIYKLSKKESYRFGELRREIPGITNAMLTTILREMEENGVITRKQFIEIPLHVEYALTQKGKDLFPIFFEILKWSAKYS